MCAAGAGARAYVHVQEYSVAQLQYKSQVLDLDLVDSKILIMTLRIHSIRSLQQPAPWPHETNQLQRNRQIKCTPLADIFRYRWSVARTNRCKPVTLPSTRVVRSVAMFFSTVYTLEIDCCYTLHSIVTLLSEACQTARHKSTQSHARLTGEIN